VPRLIIPITDALLKLYARFSLLKSTVIQ